MKRFIRLYLFVILILLPIASQAKQFFKVRVENQSKPYPFSASGAFTTPLGADDPAPLGPGQKYQFTFHALPGAKLTFITMFVQSNDLFYAPDELGIPLYMEETPVSGNITDQILLWDAGTELNQEPGSGSDQSPRQTGPNTGAPDLNNQVRLVADQYVYPPTENVIKVSLNSDMAPQFTVTIENVSTDTLIQTMSGAKHPALVSPGVWGIHHEQALLFAAGEPDQGQGLEAIAEDGNPNMLLNYLQSITGLPVPLSPGVWALHTLDAPFFTPGIMARDNGLEDLAEDGNPVVLHDSLSMLQGVRRSGIFAIPEGGDAPAPIGPGQAYEFVIVAEMEDRFSLSTMFVQSNDLIYAPDEMGINLFENDGTLRTGDITESFMLWDAGTEANEMPGIGENQAPRQSTPDTGPADPDTIVRLVDDRFGYPSIDQVIRVTLEPLKAESFTLQITNISSDTLLMPSDGSKQPVPLSPGVWAVHTAPAPIFMNGEPDREDGLEHLAEDGNILKLNQSLRHENGVLDNGVFHTPVGDDMPGPLLPGSSYVIEFYAIPGAYLSLASMFVPSNDLFYAPDEMGIPLFHDNGSKRMGEITDWIMLWDAGTEMNEEPGVGSNQVQRQPAPDTGPADSNPQVRPVSDGYDYPMTTDVVRLVLNPGSTDVPRQDRQPETFGLEQNYPNPFNPETRITYSLATQSKVTLAIFNINGQKIRELVNRIENAGQHVVTWNGEDERGHKVSSGIYFYTLHSRDNVLTRRMTLLK
ncbi:T9SS type A sorting domain-containing protein [candidate division KSB1 bacterium]|nr:T9SS type A sorting domain-containing protein [candidate division KSB1 bacterium]